jgi:ribonuclease BN (tRNA processing enzyme)
VIRGDFFNNRMWPDFFSLPSPEHPVLTEAVFKPGNSFGAGHLRVRAIHVSHPVESMAFIIRGPGGSFVYTGDTGPTERLWKSVNRLRDLRLLMIECKFPNEMQVIANAAGHYTPHTLALELAKLRDRSVPVLLYHLKPDRIEEIVQEISSLADSRLKIMKIGERIQV